MAERDYTLGELLDLASAIIFKLTLRLRVAIERRRIPNATTALARRMWQDAFTEPAPDTLVAFMVSKRLMQAMRSTDENFRFAVVMGQAYPNRNAILISEAAFEDGPQRMLFTILHELCHLKARHEKADHGPIFKKTYDEAILKFEWRHGHRYWEYRNASAN